MNNLKKRIEKLEEKTYEESFEIIIVYRDDGQYTRDGQPITETDYQELDEKHLIILVDYTPTGLPSG